MSKTEEDQILSVKKDQEIATAYNDPELVILMKDLLKHSDGVLEDLGLNVKAYQQTMADDQVISVFNQRKRAVLAAPLVVEAASEDAQDVAVADALRENLECLRMDSITDKMLNAIFFGYMPNEVIWTPGDNGLYDIKALKTRKPERFVFTADHKLRLLTKGAPFYGVEADPPYFWHMSVGAISDDNPYGLGLGHYLYWLVLFKKHGFKFWLKFLEKFAQPTMIGTFDQGSSKKDIAKLLAAIKSLSSDMGAVIPKEMAIDTLEAKRSGTVDYKQFREIINASISKIVLGQTMTTDDGSSRSQSEVHDGVKLDITRADADLFCESFNTTVAVWYTQINFPGANPPKVKRDVEPKAEPEALIERDTKIQAMGYEADEEYIQETYGPHWKKKEPEPVPAAFNIPGGPQQPTDPGDEVERFAAPVQYEDQKAIDTLIAKLDKNHGNQLSETLLMGVLKFAESNSPEDTLENLTTLLPETNFDELEDLLGGVLVMAAAHGRESE